MVFESLEPREAWCMNARRGPKTADVTTTIWALGKMLVGKVSGVKYVSD